MSKYLLDTNVLINLLKGDPGTIRHLQSFKVDQFAISVISHLEVLIGAAKEEIDLKQVEAYLDSVTVFNLDSRISLEAANFHQDSKKRLKFKDLVIAATAKIHSKTLLTADRDFSTFKDILVKFIN